MENTILDKTSNAQPPVPNDPNHLHLSEQLYSCVGEGDVEKIRTLLKQGANAAYEKYEEAAWDAFSRNSVIHILLKSKDDMETKKFMEITKMLLEAGAKLTARFEKTDWRGCGYTV